MKVTKVRLRVWLIPSKFQGRPDHDSGTSFDRLETFRLLFFTFQQAKALALISPIYQPIPLKLVHRDIEISYVQCT